MTAPIIQIAGVKSLDEALMLAGCGVTDLGFPLRLDVHQEDMNDEACARVVEQLPQSVRPVLITYLTDPGEIIALCDRLGVARVQLHAGIGVDALSRLKSLRPDLSVIKSIVVGKGARSEVLRTARELAPHAGALLTDTFDPATGASGATGKIHDWAVSRELAESIDIPLILAGGLNPDNVRRAVMEVRPAGVDAHTGVEGPDGLKDQRLCRRFVAEALAAFADIDRLA